jgi:hypothetical protein
MVEIYHVSTLQEIKSAIGHLNAHDRALLAAELFTLNSGLDEDELELSLARGLADEEAARVRPVNEVNSMIPRWTSTRESFRSQSPDRG